MRATRAVPARHRTLFQVADFALVIGPPLWRGTACIAPHIGRISPQMMPKKTNYGSIGPQIVHKKTLHGSISY